MKECEECDMKKKSYFYDGSGPSKDIVHLNACKIHKLRVAIMKENLKKIKKNNDWNILEMMRITCEIIVEERAENKEKKIMGDKV